MDWNEQTRFNRLFQSFEGTPHLEYFLRLMRNKLITNWSNAKAVLLKRCSDPESLINTERIYQRKQAQNEDVCSYITFKESLLSKIKPSLPEEYIVSQIVPGLKDEIYSRVMASSMDNPIRSVDELINRCVPIEQLVQSIEKREENKNKRVGKRVEFEDTKYNPNDRNRFRADPTSKYINNQLQDLRKMVTDLKFMSRRDNWQRNTNPNPNNFRRNFDRSPSVDRRFPNNNFPRPIKGNRELPAIEAPPGAQKDTTNVQRDTEGRAKCYNCQAYGHFARSCPKPRRQDSTAPKPKANSEN